MGPTHRRTFAVILALLAGGCAPSDTGSDAGAVDALGALPDAGPPPPPTDQLDLLFVIDDENSTTTEQVTLALAMPRLLAGLTSGDLDGDGTPDREPFTSLHFGVVTPDMGVQGIPMIGHCEVPLGDDGLLQTDAHPISASECALTYPSIQIWEAGGARTPDDAAADLGCVVRVGEPGCPFQNALESPLKALSVGMATAWTAPGYLAPSFYGGPPHGDRESDGFVRPDSILAVVILSDVDDCSARDASVYDPNSTTYTGSLGTRCFRYEAEALHPVSRYVDGLLQLRRHPSRLAFFVIAGVPRDLVPAPGAPIPWDTLAGDASVRDPRLTPTIDAMLMSNALAISCEDVHQGVARPPDRILRTARGLAERGARVGVGSICQPDYATPITSFLLSLR